MQHKLEKHDPLLESFFDRVLEYKSAIDIINSEMLDDQSLYFTKVLE